jgi:hypothetical protein
MIEVGKECVCVASFEEWTPRPSSFERAPMLHEVVTVADAVKDPDGRVWLRLRNYYDDEYAVEAFRPLTPDERDAATNAFKEFFEPVGMVPTAGRGRLVIAS